MKPHVPANNERGVALVVALLVLLVLSLLSAAMMMSVNTETLIAGHSQRETQALNTAEAGLAEAVARIRVGEIPNNMNPRMVAQVFNTNAGSVPALGADSVGLATAQPAGQWLTYSKATRDPDVLTVKYRTDTASPPTVIYRYDPTKNPAIQTTTGSAIFVITSTGYDGKDIRRIQQEVIQKPFNVNVKAALAAEKGIDFLGNSHTCGHDHSALTPAGTRDVDCQPYETGPIPPLPGGWSEGAVSSGGASVQRGQPSGYVESQTGFYAGPWEALSMSQAEFFQWIGAPLNNEPDPPRGIYYLDDNTIQGDQSGNYAYHGGDGEGMLYVDGDLTINGNFTYRGIIYVEGDTKINGTLWVLGAIIVKGKTTIKHANGNAALLYSSEAIQQALQKYGGSLVAISWRQL
jgi:Tfp pilus assembly protein PilX